MNNIPKYLLLKPCSPSNLQVPLCLLCVHSSSRVQTWIKSPFKQTRFQWSPLKLWTEWCCSNCPYILLYLIFILVILKGLQLITDTAHLSSCYLTPQAGWVRLLSVVKEWTIISIEVCIESPFIPPHWADRRGGFQGRLALAQPRAHHQITQLHLRLLNLCWSSSLTLWAPQVCWFHWRFPHWAAPWRTLHVCPGTDRERQWGNYHLTVEQDLIEKVLSFLFRQWTFCRNQFLLGYSLWWADQLFDETGGKMVSPASLFSRDRSSSDTLRKTSSRVVSITPKLVKARLSKLCSKAWRHKQQKRVLLYSVEVN